MPPQDRRNKRRNLIRFASLQSGYFTAAQALEAGYSYQAQRYNVQQENWLKVDRGIFRLPEWPPGQREDLVRWTLWSKHRAIVSHQTALSVYELGDVNPVRVHLTVPPGFRKTAPGVILHRGKVPPEDRRQHEGYSVTVPVRSILDAAAVMEIDQLARVIEDAFERGLASKRDLRERAVAFGSAAALAVERALMRKRGEVSNSHGGGGQHHSHSSPPSDQNPTDQFVGTGENRSTAGLRVTKLVLLLALAQ